MRARIDGNLVKHFPRFGVSHFRRDGKPNAEAEENIMTGKKIAVLSALLAVLFVAVPSHAEVNVNVNIGSPAVVVAGPPEMIPVPRTMIYFAPGVEGDLFYYGGYWWTPHQGRWFRSRAYKGPWAIIAPRAVPVEIVRVPRDYRKIYAHEHRVPYGQLKRHYADRDRERRERRGEWMDAKKEQKEQRKEGRAEHREYGTERGR
jgi:hypothetical protein